ncbi:hypothetical protein JQ557_18875 [Bradyrhizobium sp. U87765 SZCCT0131]|uniref:hypothetical protein n=1 Tax=unclassified Bradyrhizobium TaxID=2631580 RepID=UPI001BA52F92|nr:MULTISPECIES: hypothetical protein [unclassified Bradyrhizobium]MBR1220076.1 hypothetical protein [Bradyrhizobium sp. U87765 SZCCT0131]MBR1263468.1 hypothetical protein [Bradyrhizobium sp. U87765 SZCCT0134]MBR1309037.1 hypothetical protein [Bradyrhizobium sp. U87765 SZCCT0110]MBR1323800.1 hypothetical protein [Bradyrhizobium sp. U87765 SZCCT0109]MBR1349352.1 hypothetical protein [Bradyrhizobium sp. U87765 SZCCT0048]
MTQTIAECLARLSPDPWRTATPFSQEMVEANEKLYAARDEAEAIAALRIWLGKFQPCLFGRIAAKTSLLSYCILTEQDLQSDDETIRGKIQAARQRWTREGYEGKKSGFVVLAVSRRLAEAEPDKAMQDFALRLCELYLLDEFTTDTILLDQIFLEKPGKERATWMWRTGVNVFAAAADKRWWQDHRIPGGLGFSVNSVGHMVKSGRLAEATKALDAAFDDNSEPFAQGTVDTLEKALEFAMRTIANASPAVSGKATELLPRSDGLPACPVALPAFLADKNHCAYTGFYHTDITVPSDYFRPDVERPTDVPRIPLDFTYLFNSHVDNPAYRTMGTGTRIRGEAAPTKLTRAEPQSVPIDTQERLARALAADPG